MEPSRHDDAAIVVLDGGLSNALRDRGVVLGDDLWTARLLRDDPEAIVDVHRAYFLAGAGVATTASYQASVDGFVCHGMNAAAAGALIARSVELACEARDRVADEVAAEPLGADGTRRLLVAASIGPYGAMLHDGCWRLGHLCYHPESRWSAERGERVGCLGHQPVSGPVLLAAASESAASVISPASAASPRMRSTIPTPATGRMPPPSPTSTPPPVSSASCGSGRSTTRGAARPPASVGRRSPTARPTTPMP